MYPCFLSEKALLKNKKITSGRRKKEEDKLQAAEEKKILQAAEEKGVTKQNEGNKIDRYRAEQRNILD